MENFIKIVKNIEDEENNETNDLLIHKYTPTKIKDFEINKIIAVKIKNIIFSNSLLNLFIYGPSGSGKYTLAKFYIKTYYGESCNLKKKVIKNESKEIEYFQSKNHYEIIANTYNLNDQKLFRCLLDLIINQNNLIFGQKKNIILIKNIDLLKDNILNMLRIYIEKYYEYNTFILISSKFFKNKIFSFFCMIRIPLPNNIELKKLCIDILKKENIKVKKSEYDEIIKLSKRNITIMKTIISFSYIEDKYEKFISPTNDKLKFLYKNIKKKKVDTLILLRSLIYDLLLDNVSPDYIFRYLLTKFSKEYLTEKITYNLLLKIIEILNLYSQRLGLGLRPIVNIEACIIELMDIL